MSLIKAGVLIAFLYVGTTTGFSLLRRDACYPDCSTEPDGTYIPHPRDCDKFFVCSHGNTFLVECPGDLYFNPTLNVCDRPEAAGCEADPDIDCNYPGTTAEPTDPVTTVEVTTDPGTSVDPTDATSGQPASTDATSGQPGTTDGQTDATSEQPGTTDGQTDATSEQPGTTDGQTDATSGQPGTTTDGWQTTSDSGVTTTDVASTNTSPVETTTEEVEECELECPAPEARFPDPQDCRRFYVCVNNIAYRVTCYDEQHYWAEEEHCDTPENAQCDFTEDSPCIIITNPPSFNETNLYW